MWYWLERMQQLRFMMRFTFASPKWVNQSGSAIDGCDSQREHQRIESVKSRARINRCVIRPRGSALWLRSMPRGRQALLLDARPHVGPTSQPLI